MDIPQGIKNEASNANAFRYFAAVFFSKTLIPSLVLLWSFCSERWQQPAEFTRL